MVFKNVQLGYVVRGLEVDKSELMNYARSNTIKYLKKIHKENFIIRNLDNRISVGYKATGDLNLKGIVKKIKCGISNLKTQNTD